MKLTTMATAILTTFLVDGIPTHTMMSGFYGLDAVSTMSFITL